MSESRTRPKQAADHRSRLALALAVVALALAALPSLAAAQDFGSDEPALDEYTESLPLAHGNRPAGHKGHSSPLPASTRQVLASTPHGKALERIATSPAAGAPSSEPAASRAHARVGDDSAGPADRRVRPKDVSSANLASAVAHTAGGGASSLLVLALLACVPIILMITRRRSKAR